MIYVSWSYSYPSFIGGLNTYNRVINELWYMCDVPTHIPALLEAWIHFGWLPQRKNCKKWATLTLIVPRSAFVLAFLPAKHTLTFRQHFHIHMSPCWPWTFFTERHASRAWSKKSGTLFRSLSLSLSVILVPHRKKGENTLGEIKSVLLASGNNSDDAYTHEHNSTYLTDLFSQFRVFNTRRTTFLNYIKFDDLLIGSI